MSKDQTSGVVGKVVAFAVIMAVYGGYHYYNNVWAVENTEKSIQAELPKVGACFSTTGTTFDAEVHERDCADDKAEFKAFKIIGNDSTETCEELGGHASFESWISYTNREGASSTVCGLLNVGVGDCVKDGLELARAACDDSAASPRKVLSMVDVKDAQQAENEAFAVRECGPKARTWIAFVPDRKIACIGAV